MNSRPPKPAPPENPEHGRREPEGFMDWPSDMTGGVPQDYEMTSTVDGITVTLRVQVSAEGFASHLADYGLDSTVATPAFFLDPLAAQLPRALAQARKSLLESLCRATSEYLRIGRGESDGD